MNFQTAEEHNKFLNEQGLAGYDKKIQLNFRSSKKVFFKVEYGDLDLRTQNPYFSMTSGILNRNRTDWNEFGASLNDAIKRRDLINFYKKWEEKHLKVLTIEEYTELENDLNKLKENIPFIESDRFYDIVKFDRELSK